MPARRSRASCALRAKRSKVRRSPFAGRRQCRAFRHLCQWQIPRWARSRARWSWASQAWPRGLEIREHGCLCRRPPRRRWQARRCHVCPSRTRCWHRHRRCCIILQHLQVNTPACHHVCLSSTSCRHRHRSYCIIVQRLQVEILASSLQRRRTSSVQPLHLGTWALVFWRHMVPQIAPAW